MSFFFVLVAILSWLSLFISARRVAFILGSLASIILLFRHSKRKLMAALSLAIITPILFAFLDVLGPSLYQVILEESFGDILFYLNWAWKDVQKGFLMTPSILYGGLGLTSPGSQFVVSGPLPVSGIIETTLSKTMYSLGLVGALQLLAIQGTIIIETIKYYRRTNDWLIATGVFYFFSIILWNIKSGEYLVWMPLTMVNMGLLYAAMISLRFSRGRYKFGFTYRK